MTVSLFLFHRDIRLEDNTALIAACKESEHVILAFIFPPEQIDSVRNKYFSHAAVQFMCESIKHLPNIHLFKGDNIECLDTIYKHKAFSKLFQNEDYSVYARKRDAEIQKWCRGHGVEYKTHEDYGLFPMNEGLLPDSRPYTILAQFYKRYLKDLKVREVDNYRHNTAKFVGGTFPGEMRMAELVNLYRHNDNLAERGGRPNGLLVLNKLRHFAKYKETRDYPFQEKGTTKLSAHLKFGTISIREVYWECVKRFGTRDHPLIRELIFREFYLKLYGLNPRIQRGVAPHEQLDKHIPWRYDKDLTRAWQEGATGFPLVDAGMRQLKQVNWCHNRVRMLVASVATKYLLLDWRDCARYFYTQLVDADTYSNTAGWGWASSTGYDATLYFRAPFNPYIQSKKFDKDAIYIKRFVPELEKVAPADIHKWFDPKVRAKYPDVNYPHPIVDHKEASARAIAVFKQAAAEARQKSI
jgi:deoxyribodipyrimidine photo-lyase